MNEMKLHEDFFSLMRSGLWGDEINTVSPDTDWMEMLELAEKQSCLAIVYDGIQLLPKDRLPDIDTFMEWIGQANYVETCNNTLNRDVASLVSFMNDHGIASRLMKGQGCATYYPHPKHRNGGDIDLFVGMENYNQAKAAIIERGIKIECETLRDAQFKWGKSHVELHRLQNHFNWEPINKRLQLIFRTEEWQSPRIVKIGGEDVALFNPTLNVFHIFVHLYHHFLQLGVGLRQICDWMMVMKAEENCIDWDKLHEYIKDVRIERAWNAFYGLTVKYLGQRLSDVPSWMMKYREGDVALILSEVMAGGNFGYYGESMKLRKRNEGVSSNRKAFWSQAKRLWRVQRFGRSEVLAYPLWKLTHDFSLWNRYLKK